MRPRVVLRYAGEIGLVVGVTTLVPITGAAVFGEWRLVAPYAAVGLFFVGLGLLARRLPVSRDLQRNEALVVTTVVFAWTPVVLCVPLLFEGIPFLDALFEAVSGVTTTGLSTLASVEAHSRTFLLVRAWLQWIGGLGFVVLALALTWEPGVAARRLGAAGLELSDVEGSVRRYARRVLQIYLGMTALGIALLLALGASGFDALVHTLAAVSTGGFAPRDDSLASLGRPLQAAVLGISLCGAVSLPIWGELHRRNGPRPWRDLELRCLLVLVLLGTAALIVVGPVDEGSRPGPFATLLLVVSAQSTTGFQTFSLDGLSAFAQVVLIAAMLSGGSHGSTAGGVKLLRVVLSVRLVQWLIVRTRLPSHAVAGPTLGGDRLSEGDLSRAAALVLLYGAVVGISWLPFLAAGHPPLGSLFEVASAAGTVGLTRGIAGPELEPYLKGVLCLNMLLGRLEVFAVLVTLAPGTWIGRRTGG